MTLVDIAGRQQQVRFAGNRIDLSSLGRGIYLLVVSTSDGRTVKHKIVKL
jgi:hypothetical protein